MIVYTLCLYVFTLMFHEHIRSDDQEWSEKNALPPAACLPSCIKVSSRASRTP